MKPFKTYRQQLRILRERNLTIKNGNKAIKMLKRGNYYNIINGYKEIFLIKNTGNIEKYKDNTTIEDIYALYNFDRNLRILALKYILHTEAFLKSLVSYYFSKKYRLPFSFFNINNFDQKDLQKTTTLISRISTELNRNTEKLKQGQQPQTSFSHYLSKHKELPLWVLVQKLTLGETVNLFSVLKEEIKEEILKTFCHEYETDYKTKITCNPNSIYDLTKMFYFINDIRNICAHEDRLYDHISKHNGKIARISYFFMNKTQSFSARVIDLVFILGFLLSKKEYKTFIKEITYEINNLENELDSKIFNQILIRMGFKKTWKSDLKLPK